MANILGHIVGFIMELIRTAMKYITVFLILLFDSIIFSYPLIFINNVILNKVYSLPELNYFQGAALIFLFKLLAVLWKSVKLETEKEIIYIKKKEEEN